MTLEMKVKFDFGLKFLGPSESKFGFFRAGVLTAVFWLVGRRPAVSDALHTAHMNGSTASTDSSNTSVGIGPRVHVFRGERSSILRTSFGVNSRKVENSEPSNCRLVD